MSGVNSTLGNGWIDPWAIRNTQLNRIDPPSREEIPEEKEIDEVESKMEVEDPLVNELAGQMSGSLEIDDHERIEISQAKLDALGKALLPFVVKSSEERKHLMPTLSSEVKELFQRKWFLLGMNELTSIPSAFEVLTQITELDLSRNKITEIPENLFVSYTNLTDLNLDFTRIKKLPDSIGNCKNLKNLSINRSFLIELPSTIGKLENLIKMVIRRSKLAKLPSEIGNLAQLQELCVSDSQLKKLPDEICKLMKLKDLDVSKNALTHLPSDLSQLTNLTNLDASNNQLQELPKTLDMQHLKKLARVNFKKNPLVVPLSAELREIDTSCRLSKEERIQHLRKKNKSEEEQFDQEPSKIRINETRSGCRLVGSSEKPNSEDSSDAPIKKVGDLEQIPNRKIVRALRGKDRPQLPSKASASSDNEDW